MIQNIKTTEVNNIDYLMTMASDVLEAWKNKQVSLRIWASWQESNCMARWLGQSMSNTAGLVVCSWDAVFKTYQKWSKEKQPVNEL